MKHDPITTANALAATTAIIYTACRLLVALFPDLMFAIAQSWLHGVELTKLGTWNLTFVSFILGIITSAAFAWGIGYIFARSYNFFLAKK
ncbi:hypothetical protein A2771_04365 [Candidatus Woesebacteria bacterium RIFCSPHIGHO2_01_FULL_38_26b]|uniref:DUF2062 domain-containing protein n=1 Tax=Candidatus Woesebacteria bacterium RIFCSPHIGHO2_01_FULL_38_26b TaxID=1802491 RepID=A0A1F7Y113_9BACT|nr:MAG: hypothetical protein A2771_04365 [Candidatus Woesebacteria bacterium RIFCSPHIGHO2_01_FULL_38_26b]